MTIEWFVLSPGTDTCYVGAGEPPVLYVQGHLLGFIPTQRDNTVCNWEG